MKLAIFAAFAAIPILAGAQDAKSESSERVFLPYKEEQVQASIPFKASIFSSEKQVAVSGILWTPRVKSDDERRRFPLFIMNHGSQDGNRPKDVTRVPAMGAILTLVENGFAVLAPIRNGFRRNQDNPSEVNVDTAEPVTCSWAGLDSGVNSAKESVKAVLGKLQSRDDLDLTRIVVAGQSRGGFLALALASDQLPGVIGVINLAGGWHGEPCAQGNSYNMAKFTHFGRTIGVPVLSYYGTNDSYYAEPVVRSFVDLLGANKKAVATISPGYNHFGHLRDYEPWTAAAMRLFKGE